MGSSTFPYHLYKLEGFQRLYEPVLLNSVLSQFPLLQLDNSISELVSPDWNYLLLCASILSKSDEGSHQDVSFRIAQYALHSTETDELHKLGAAVVLDSLTSIPAIKLAIKRGLIEEGYLEKLPLTMKLETIKRGIQYSIIENEQNELIHINRFQKDVYALSKENDWVSISAPTSAGKSFILLQILMEKYRERKKTVSVYLVPTRALISQVETDLVQTFLKHDIQNVIITSLPAIPKDLENESILYVLTQERLQWLFNDEKDFTPDVVVVDEAQKISDGYRGMILQQVIEETMRRSSSTKFYFSSPMTDNPGILLKYGPESIAKEIVKTEQISVNQNLIWASQVKGNRKLWDIELCLKDEIKKLGKLELPYRPTSDLKRLSFIAHSLSNDKVGNLIYVNGPSEAEKVARQLWDLQGSNKESNDVELLELIGLVKKAVHNDYSLGEVLKRKVAYHYGNMPLLVKNEIERLFKVGKIEFLVCTSTLIEGINLPARSIFVRGPRKGRGKPMNDVDFWNLAGRAGRQGKEFQGNVVCIDPRVEEVWKVAPPTHKSKYTIEPSIDTMVTKTHKELLTFIEEGAPRSQALSSPNYEYALSYFYGEYLREGSLSNTTSLDQTNPEFREKLETEFTKIDEKIELSKEIILSNPGVSPIAQQNLFHYFKCYTGDLENLIPAYPENENALDNYIEVVGRISGILSGDSLAANYPNAKVVVEWMRGYSLSSIIKRNWDYWDKKGQKNLSQVIRETMAHIEEYARFKFVKYSACYINVLKYYFKNIERHDLLEQIPQLNIWLEFGASQKTQVSLMSLGLSRTSAISLSDIIVADNLNMKECMEWLTLMNIESLDLSRIIKDEIIKVFHAHSRLISLN